MRWVPGLRCIVPDDASHRRENAAPHPGHDANICSDVFPACQIPDAGRASSPPTQSRAELQMKEAAMGQDVRSPRGPRCIALVGPFQSGKTTLLEAILARTGAIPRAGSVDAGTSVGDASPEARHHKIDRASKRIRETLATLQPASRIPLVLRQIPIWNGELIAGFVDLALERAFVYREHKASEVVALEGGDLDREKEARFSMLEKLADHDDALMEQLLE